MDPVSSVELRPVARTVPSGYGYALEGSLLTAPSARE